MPRFTRLSAADRRRQLIEAASASMAEDGIAGFTVDRICARAGVSRGLITHHFGGMAGLMAATYAQLYDEDIPQTPGLAALFDALFAPEKFNRPRLNAWLALWQAIATTPELSQEHRRRYADYRTMVAEALAASGQDPGRAPLLIALIDGLSLQHCIDPASMPPEAARAACESFLAPPPPRSPGS